MEEDEYEGEEEEEVDMSDALAYSNVHGQQSSELVNQSDQQQIRKELNIKDLEKSMSNRDPSNRDPSEMP